MHLIRFLGQRRIISGIVMSTVLLGSIGSTSADALTFNRDIAPIVYQQCVHCHRPGEVAPFSLLTYQDVHKRAWQIALLTERRLMPPWKLEPGYGEFQHERRLTEAQIAAIQQWVAQGASEGDPADLPPVPKFADGWKLGKPDLILKMPKAFTIPAEGKDVNRSFVVPVHLPADRYIRAAEFRPGNRRVVHHATLMYDKSGKARLLEAQQGGPGAGYVSFGGPGFLPTGALPGYAPGLGPEIMPEDASGVLPRDIDVVFGMHYHPDGKEETDQSSIGLYFTDKPPRRIGSLITMGVLNVDIAPGEKSHQEQDAYTLPVDVEVENVYEHMHLIGKTCKLWAELPDHTTRPIIKINDWDFNWQSTYHVKQRFRLPKDTVLRGEWTYDNTAENIHNPNHPPKRVTNGESSTDEMAGVLIGVYVDSDQDNGVLWIANLGHLFKASVTPAVHRAPEQKNASLGLMLLQEGSGPLTDLLIGMIQEPLRTIVISLTLLVMTVLAVLLIPALLFPHVSVLAANRLTASPLRCFGAGLLPAAGIYLLALPLLFSQNRIAQVLSLILLSWITAAWLVGMGGMTRKVRQRFFRQEEREVAFTALVKSSLLVTAVICLPLLGWLVIAPLAMLIALGAGVSALLPSPANRRRF